MRLLGLALVLAIGLVQPALAQSPDRVGPPPPVKPREQPVPAPVSKPMPTARQTQAFASGGLGAGMMGLQPLRPFSPLVGLPATGDQAPLCRAVCAKVHNQCSGDETCDTNWVQCVRACQ